MNMKSVQKNLICVSCNTNIEQIDTINDTITCTICGCSYPFINRIPVIIDEKRSIFSFSDFLSQRNLFFDISKKGKVVALISKILPEIGGNNLGRNNFNFLERLLKEEKGNSKPRVLVIGASIVGAGMDKFIASPDLDIVESDVSFGPRTQIIFDAHQIPYSNESFDCVIVQAVLEHVLDSAQCVAEIHRVLKTDGLVYAETPFMQQVHGGPYDFTRYSRSGHRKLFKDFKELKSGMTAGAGTSMAWAYQYFLLSLLGYNSFLKLLVKSFARITGFWMKYFDYLMQFNTRSSDGASGFYFIGQKSTTRLTDKDVIEYYK
jgi:SAM-dependent methyltransferase